MIRQSIALVVSFVICFSAAAKGLFDLYKAWRDANKVGFNRVDLEKLAVWLEERAG